MRNERRSVTVSSINYPKLRIAGVIQNSIVDGPGLRYVIFAQGCPHRCKGCHNPQTHDFAGGKETNIEELLTQINKNPLQSGVTFSGGEPFSQAEAFLPLARRLKSQGKHLMVYTGYLLEDLEKSSSKAIQELLELTDILVDGSFIMEERDLTLAYRGSKNQRVIDMKKTRAAGEVILYQSEYEDM